MTDATSVPTVRRLVETGRQPIAVTEAAAAGAPPLVLVHGIGSRAESWWPVLGPLAERFHVYAVDLRGHGGSGKPGAGYLLDDYAADLGALLDALGLERPFVLGHSLGAMTTMLWAVRQPGRAAKIVLEDPPLRTEPAILDAFDGWMQLNAAPLEAVAFWYQSEHPDWSWEECRRRAESITSTHPAVFAELRAASAAALAQPGPGRDPRLDALAAIDAPTLLVRGDPDLGSMVGPDDVAEIAAAAPQVVVRRIPGTGHSIHREQPEAFVREVVGFLGD